MWKIIVSFVLWLVKKWSAPPSTRKLQEKVDELTREIVILEKLPRTYNRVKRLSQCYRERVTLNRRIARTKGEEK